MSSIMEDYELKANIILGALSCIFWTLTLQTTVKYVVITLRADNKGEGGIFSLYTLVKRTKIGWLIFPAIIGGSCLLADGIITPPISVSAAIEGLRRIEGWEDMETKPLVFAILTVLFIIQQFGTNVVGKFFGPVTLVWFLMLGVIGIVHISGNLEIFQALNPYHAYELLKEHPEGFLVLGGVFLCTTGAEALYSDMGHCGIKNIRLSWGFVKTTLLLNYFGQGAWMMSMEGSTLQGVNPFYGVMPHWFLPFGIAVATMAAIVASQAMITGSFTLINEAMRLNFWPKVRINYPSNLKGQLYIPSINWLLWSGCMVVVWHFQDSSEMEAAYGLAIIGTMMMTTILMTFYLIIKRYSPVFVFLFAVTYVILESAFMVAQLSKFMHGGWITLLIASNLALVMLTWYKARRIKNRYVEFVKLPVYANLIAALSNDMDVPKHSTHLVYLTAASNKNEIDSKIIYSILQRQPKRADIYWFVHVEVDDEPYTMEYKVNQIVKDDIVRIDFNLGFRIAPRIGLMFRKVVEEMVNNKEVDITSRYKSLHKHHVIGDFKFVVMEKYISPENELPFFEKIILDIYYLLKRFSLSEEKAFGLDTSSVSVEKVPMVISPVRKINLVRVG
jgi:KUP system potassium uptake protein